METSCFARWRNWGEYFRTHTCTHNSAAAQVPRLIISHNARHDFGTPLNFPLAFSIFPPTRCPRMFHLPRTVRCLSDRHKAAIFLPPGKKRRFRSIYNGVRGIRRKLCISGVHRRGDVWWRRGASRSLPPATPASFSPRASSTCALQTGARDVCQCCSSPEITCSCHTWLDIFCS